MRFLLLMSIAIINRKYKKLYAFHKFARKNIKNNFKLQDLFSYDKVLNNSCDFINENPKSFYK